MPAWAVPLAVLAAYVVLMRRVLPKLGIPTCMSGSCAIAPRREKKE